MQTPSGRTARAILAVLLRKPEWRGFICLTSDTFALATHFDLVYTWFP